MNDPFLLPPRSVVSFSGGRTSALMLRRILDSFGGKLPDDRRVVFCNTGKERDETLDFVDRCSRQWDVAVAWVEYRCVDGKHTFTETDFATASRNGEPFEAIIRHHREYRAAKSLDPVLPNPPQRFCTSEMKIRTINRFVRQQLGWETYQDAIGLRADEERRGAPQTIITDDLFGETKTKIRGAHVRAGETPVFPLYDAGITEPDVMEFWDRQDFDLELKQYQGNCDLCFLKSSKKILDIMRESPSLANWWIEQERANGQTFRNDRPSYAKMLAIATDKEVGPGWLYADKSNDGSCGEIDECRCTD